MSALSSGHSVRLRAYSRALLSGRSRMLSIGAAAFVLSGCAILPDGAMSVPVALARSELHKEIVGFKSEQDVAQAEARVAALARKPLTADSAVQIALLNNRSLQAAYNELGLADALRLRQSLPPNPAFSLTRLAGAAEVEIDRQIVMSILGLVTLPERSAIASARFRQAQLTAALETFRLATETRRAFYRAVAARQTANTLQGATSASGTAAELAKRLNESGAINKLERAREEAFHLELTTQVQAARQRALTAREQLTRLLGLSAVTAIKLPSSLPRLPGKPLRMRDIEEAALDKRIDLQIAKIELETLGRSYGLTKATRFINVLEAGYADKVNRNKEMGERTFDQGFTLTFEVPIFDFGESRVQEARERYMQAVNRLAQKAIDARSEARNAYRSYRTAYDIAGTYQGKLLPLRKLISDELVLHYGAMQIDVFALLTDARQKIASHVAAIEAQRDVWLQATDLSAAMYGVGSAADAPATATAAPTAASD